MRAKDHTDAAFVGFGPATIRFLQELEENNNRDWFKANKHRYDIGVMEPAFDFISLMGPELERISPHFLAVPKRIGGSLMRVYRDMRFSRNKAPYKTNIGIQFRHDQGKDVHAPGYYLHIESSGCFLAAGMWHPAPTALKDIRDRIVERPDAWRRVRESDAFNRAFSFGGSSLKRAPRGYDEQVRHIEDIKRKDFIAATNFSLEEAAQQDFPKKAATAYAAASPLMAFLCSAVNVPF